MGNSATRLRFVTAASLFDGHDASINIMRRILQSSGVEVIHLGHNRSAQAIVRAALEEDAHGIALSSYQGGHVEFFEYVVELLKKNGAGHVRVFGGGGGTITPDEATRLEAKGVTKIYSPEDGRQLGLQGMIDDMIRRCGEDPTAHLRYERLKNFATDPIALAQTLTCVELLSEAPEWKAIEAKLATAPKAGVVIGITGTGGAGKSSLTDELVLRVLDADPKARIAVLAVDPTRKKTGGALLGDRLRMNALSNERTYMRSFATRQANAPVSAAAKAALQVLRAAGYEWIFFETGGIGQADTSLVDLADIQMYVMTGEYGAPTQLEKINMLDYADVVVINKVDKLGALDAIQEVKRQFRRNHREFERLPLERYPVFGSIASRFHDPGVDAVFRHLNRLRTEEKKRIATDFDFHWENSGNPGGIVPRGRAGYLSEVATHVRQYHETTAQQATLLAQVEALTASLADDNVRTEAKAVLQELRERRERELEPTAIAELKRFEQTAIEYAGDRYEYSVRDKRFITPLTTESLSHNAIRRVTVPAFTSRAEALRFVRRENLPGFFPFTAGVFPFKRTEEDPKRQFAGEGTPEQTNRRFHLLCDGEKAKRLSTAFDSVTLYGEDPDERPDIFGKIGESGVSVCTLDDAKKLYAGFDLCDPSTSVSMTINGPAPMLLAFFFNTAIDQQRDKFRAAHGRAPNPDEDAKLVAGTLTSVRGTVQADILKEDQAQNTCIFSTDFALRMMGDIQQFFVENQVRNYYSVSISGYHIAEAGANPISQLAFTLANGFTYVEYYLSRGMKIDDFAPNFSFFFSNALDPEYLVLGRVARRIWAIAMRDLYRGNERSQKLKYHIQTSGRSLHAQEISFNDIRTTLQALMAFLDNCNSLHTNAYDEAVTTPTEESVRRAMAIQLIIAKELGWTKNENPLQGSYFVEELTDLVETAVLNEFDRLSARGGVLGAMETQYQRSKIQEESMHYEHLKHSGELPIIGVNTFLNATGDFEASLPKDLVRASYDEKNAQIRNLRAFQRQHAAESALALDALKEAARKRENIFAALMRAARVCSLGQMSRALYAIGGEYRRSV